MKRYFPRLVALLILVTAGGCATSAPPDPLLPVRQFMAAMMAENKEAAEAVLTANAEFVLPFNPNGDPTERGVRRFPAPVYLSLAFDNYDNIAYPNPLFHIANNGATVFMESVGDLKVARTGRSYRNRYLFRFDVYDGRIERVFEYSNPVTAARDGALAGR